MPDPTPCNHCGRKESVLAVADPTHSRTIYVCLECNWWGTDATNIAYPLPEKASIKIVWPDSAVTLGGGGMGSKALKLSELPPYKP